MMTFVNVNIWPCVNQVTDRNRPPNADFCHAKQRWSVTVIVVRG